MRIGHGRVQRETQSGTSGQEELLLTTGHPKIATDWSRDGRCLVFTETDSGTGDDIWLLPMSGDGTPFEYLRTPFNETQARVSPDGRWLAYRSDESGRNEVYVQGFPEPGRKVQVSTNRGEQPQWRHDGRELFDLSPEADNQFMAVDILSKPGDPGFDVGVPRELFVINVVTGPVASGQLPQRNSYELWNDGEAAAEFLESHHAPGPADDDRAQLGRGAADAVNVAPGRIAAVPATAAD